MASSLSRRRLLGLAGLALGAAAVGLERSAAGRAAPPPGPPLPLALNLPPRGERRLVVISDLNGPYGSVGYRSEVDRGVALIRSLRPDLVLCGGDLIAAQKDGLGAARLAAMWAGFDARVLAPIRAADVPVAFTLGNHDASNIRSASGAWRFADDRRAAERFWQPRREALGLRLLDASGFPFRYTALQDGLFLAVLDASGPVLGEEQLAWLDRALSSAAARGARSRIVMGHLPLVGIARGRERPGEVLQQAGALRALLERQGVGTYVSGHQHAWYPGRLGRLDLLCCGALGDGPRRLLGSVQPPFQTLTVWDLFPSRGVSVFTTLDMRSLRPVPLASLPAAIEGPTGRLRRRDLVLSGS
ncbi:MAG: metallophosphoesterase [Synechococcaceae cyanobacterium]|nr:metallophosphoesterase [Synechococcaceae cyanobacterium]